MIRANDIQLVIGSWGSYNECNERALGSKWICLSDYEDWKEIEEELTRQGFDLEGIDEELFIQDIENFPCDSGVNWDYVHPKTLFELLKKSGILDDAGKYEKAEIYCEIEGYREWQRLVEEYEDDWDRDIYLYPGFDWYDLGVYFFNDVFGYTIPSELEDFFDMKKYGESFEWDGFYEYSDGIVEIRR